jgi:hypothetical protein
VGTIRQQDGPHFLVSFVVQGSRKPKAICSRDNYGEISIAKAGAAAERSGSNAAAAAVSAGRRVSARLANVLDRPGDIGVRVDLREPLTRVEVEEGLIRFVHSEGQGTAGPNRRVLATPATGLVEPKPGPRRCGVHKLPWLHPRQSSSA